MCMWLEWWVCAGNVCKKLDVYLTRVLSLSFFMFLPPSLLLFSSLCPCVTFLPSFLTPLLLSRFSSFACSLSLSLSRVLIRIIHLFFTLLFDFFVLRHVEKYLGWFRTAFIYVGSGIGGNIVSAVFVPYSPEVSAREEHLVLYTMTPLKLSLAQE